MVTLSTSWNSFSRLISNSSKTVHYKGQSTKIGKDSELLQMQESHLKVNSIRFSAEANFVMTESWKDLVSMTSVGNCDSMDIRPKSESLSCSILFWENDLIRFKEENDLSTDLGLPAATTAFFFFDSFLSEGTFQ